MSDLEELSEQGAALLPSLLSIMRSLRALHGIKLGTLGFYNGQDEMLFVLDPEGKTISKVADELSVRASTVSKMVDRLEVRGLAERINDGRDRRRTLVRITADGVEARIAIQKANYQLDRDLLKNLAGDTHETIRGSLADVSLMLAAQLKRQR